MNNTTIDGNGYRITGMTVNAESVGGFIDNNASSLTIKNVTFFNANVSTPSYESGKSSQTYAGIVIGKNYSTTVLENITVKNSKVTCSWQCGGLVGFSETNSPKFINCDVEDTFIGGYNATAGILFGLGNVAIEAMDCDVKNVSLYTDMGPTTDEGFHAGHLYGKEFTGTNCTVTDCEVVSEYV